MPRKSTTAAPAAPAPAPETKDERMVRSLETLGGRLTAFPDHIAVDIVPPGRYQRDANARRAATRARRAEVDADA